MEKGGGYTRDIPYNPPVFHLGFPNDLHEPLHVALNLHVVLEHRLNGSSGVDNGRVVPVELLPDIALGHIKHLTAEVHGDMTGMHDGAAASRADEIAMAYLVIFLHRPLDVLNGDSARQSTGEVVLQEGPYFLHGDVTTFAHGSLIKGHLGNGAFQFTNVRPRDLSNIELHVVGKGQMPKSLTATELVGKGLDNTKLGLDVGRLDVDGGAGSEARLVALVEADALGGAIGRQHYLATAARKGIEQLEHDIEGTLFALELLDVVDEQHVGFLVEGFEVLETALFPIMGGTGLGVLVGDAVGIHKDGAEVWVGFSDVVLDGSHEMGLSQAALAIDEQGVEGAPARLFGHLHGHLVGKTIRRADDEIAECVG